jgi:thiamine biosynthesis lipoprotein
MGTDVTISVRDEEVAATALDRAFADLHEVDAKFSPFLGDSLVSQVNRGEIALNDALELRVVANLCRLYESATAGVFHAWHESRFDPSGLVKGWAIDRACTILDGAGGRSYFVEAGGDVRARGGRAPGEPWRIGIRHPVDRQEVVRVVVAEDIAVATSGTYEKGDHIWNRAATATPLLSFTVAGPDIVEADVFATAGFAMGLDGLNLVEAKPGFEAYAIDAALVAHWTSGFDALCDPAHRGVKLRTE